jgi:hypothetical protein
VSSIRSGRATPTARRTVSSKGEKSWNTAVIRDRQSTLPTAVRGDAVEADRAAVRLVESAQQLGEARLAGAVLPHHGDNRAGRQEEADVFQHRPLATGIGEGDIVEANAGTQFDRRRNRAGRFRHRRGHVRLQPQQPLRRAEPVTVQEVGLGHQLGEILRHSAACDEDHHHLPRRGVQHRRGQVDRRRVGAAEQGPRGALPHRSAVPCRSHPLVTVPPGRPVPLGHVIAETSDANLLGGTGAGAEQEQVPCVPDVSRGGLLGQPYGRRLGRPHDYRHDRTEREQKQRGMYRHEQREDEDDPDERRDGGENGTEEVVEREDLVPEHRQRPAVGRGQQPIEDFQFTTDVELRRRFIEDDQAGALAYRAEDAGQRYALPLPAGQIPAVRPTAAEHHVEISQIGYAHRDQRLTDRRVRRAARGDVVPHRQLEADEILEHRGDPLRIKAVTAGLIPFLSRRTVPAPARRCPCAESNPPPAPVSRQSARSR